MNVAFFIAGLALALAAAFVAVMCIWSREYRDHNGEAANAYVVLFGLTLLDGIIALVALLGVGMMPDSGIALGWLVAYIAIVICLVAASVYTGKLACELMVRLSKAKRATRRRVV
jgi:hypothetical protein